MNSRFTYVLRGTAILLSRNEIPPSLPPQPLPLLFLRGDPKKQRQDPTLFILRDVPSDGVSIRYCFNVRRNRRREMSADSCRADVSYYTMNFKYGFAMQSENRS